jgi:ABC-type antimicrobial peptide transport system permease subunit
MMMLEQYKHGMAYEHDVTTCTGSALGLLGAFGVSNIIASAFPGIRTDNFLVLAGTTFLLVAIALLACWLPARRAGKVNPVDALRAE